MKLFGALVLFLTLSTACGLKCYMCATTDSTSCTSITTCSAVFNRCFSLNLKGFITKGCQNQITCTDSMNCCEGDLCNNARLNGPSVILLLVSSSFIALFH